MKNQIKKGSFLTVIGGGALAFALSASPAFAESGADPAGMPVAKTSATEHQSGTVTGIDKSTRTVTLKTDAGDPRSFQVSPDVEGFDKLKKGDKVDVDYTESIAIAMLPKGTKLSANEQAAAMKTGTGWAGRPAGHDFGGGRQRRHREQHGHAQGAEGQRRDHRGAGSRQSGEAAEPQAGAGDAVHLHRGDGGFGHAAGQVAAVNRSRAGCSTGGAPPCIRRKFRAARDGTLRR